MTIIFKHILILGASVLQSHAYNNNIQCGRVDDLSLLTISERINGGELADIGSWPWQVRKG